MIINKKWKGNKMKKRNKLSWRKISPVWWPKGPPKKGNYGIYIFSGREFIKYLIIGSGFIFLVAKTFYDSVLACIFLIPFLYFYLDQKSKKLQKKRLLQLEKEFRDTILAVSSNLQAGFSVENSFKEARKDIQMLYGNDADMVYELLLMEQELNTNQTLEKILQSIADRTKSEDILEFSQIFHIAKKSGGDIRNVIMNTSNVIKEKMSVRLELETALAEKRLEQSIMKGMPFFIVFYISLTTRNFFDRLYHNPIGIIIMTGCLAGYVIACLMMDRILEIEI